jgi:hypothetical protein
MRLFSRVTVFVLFAVAASAQETKPAAPAPPKRASSTMDKIQNSQAAKVAAQKDAEREKLQPAPTNTSQPPAAAPEFEKVAKLFAGRWRTMEKHEPSQWLPNGGQGSGMETITYGPGRYSLVLDYRSSGSLGPFQGHAMFMWDATAKKYRSAWTDSISAGTLSLRSGNWEGNDLVMTGTDEANGTKTDFREVFTDFKDNGFTFYMEMSPAGKKQWKRLLTITYTKLDAASMMMGDRMRRMPQRPPMSQPEDKKQ